MMIIRDATAADIPRILEMRRRSYDYGRLAELVGPFDEDHFRATFESALSGPRDRTWLFVAEYQGETVGVIFGVVTSIWLARDVRCACETFIWIEPEMRGLGIGSAMIKASEEWAKRNDVDFISMFSYPNLDPHRMTYVCAQRGYVEMETNHMRRLT